MFDEIKLGNRILENLALMKPNYEIAKDFDPGMTALIYQGLSSTGKKARRVVLAKGLEAVLNRLAKTDNLKHTYLVYQRKDKFYKLPIEDFQKETSPV